jgi:3-hydroxybutyryl-CoA dehydrogenase
MSALQIHVIGCGRMGSQIGLEYAIAGHMVAFTAPHPAPAIKRVKTAIDLAARIGLAVDGEAVAAWDRMTIDTDPHPDCDLVIESVPEDFELKVEVLRPVAERCPDAIIATNTSSLSISALGSAIGATERTLGTHYWDPPLLMPLVEVIAGEQTAPETVARVSDILESLGKRPVTVARDVPGFAWNRLQLAVLREALWLVENDLTTPETVDAIMREGLARRWRHVGPFETARLGGVATWRRIGENILPALSTATFLESLERWLPHADEQTVADARARRDAALASDLVADGATPQKPVADAAP